MSLTVKHKITNSTKSMIYNYWIHEIVNKGEADKYIILEYPDLVQLIIIKPGGKTEKDRILERDKAKEEIKKFPNAFDFEEIDVKELITTDIKQSNSVKKKLNKTQNRNFKISKNDIKKVVSLLDRKNELSVEIAAKELKFDIKKTGLIFQTLIENNDVIDLSSKTGISIAKKRISSYKSLSSNTPRFRSTISKLAKKPIIQIISILVLLYTFLKIIEAIFNIDIPKI